MNYHNMTSSNEHMYAQTSLLGLAHKAITVAVFGLKRPAQAWTSEGNSPTLGLE